MAKQRRFRGSWSAYCAAVWALVFAVLHIVWAAGWHVGLPEEQSRAAFQRPWFVAYDLIVAGLCAIAVFVALALVQAWGRQVPSRLLSALAWTGTGLLVLRAGASAVQIGYLLATGRFVVDEWTPWELWFYLGAVLFGLSMWRFHRDKAARSNAA